MTLNEREQAIALRECVIDAALPDVQERDGNFIKHMAYRATNDPHYPNSERQKNFMRALAWRYRDELIAADKWKLFMEKTKA